MWSFAAEDNLDPKDKAEKHTTLEYLQSEYFLKSFFILFIYFLFTAADFPTLSNNSTSKIPPFHIKRPLFRRSLPVHTSAGHFRKYPPPTIPQEPLQA